MLYASDALANMGAAKIKLSPIGIVVIGLVVVAFVYYFSIDGVDGDLSNDYFAMEGSVSLKQLVVAAIHLAESGGEVVRKVRLGGDLGVSEKFKRSLSRNLLILQLQTNEIPRKLS